jgi:hypothetical protein
VVVVDPPPLAEYERCIGIFGQALEHHAWSGAGELPELCWAERWQPRAALAQIYRGLGAKPLAGPALAEVLCGSADRRRAPTIAGRCVRVLGELGIAELSGERGERALRVVSSERTELERSGSWRRYTARYEEGLRYLQNRQVT